MCSNKDTPPVLHAQPCQCSGSGENHVNVTVSIAFGLTAVPGQITEAEHQNTRNSMTDNWAHPDRPGVALMNDKAS